MLLLLAAAAATFAVADAHSMSYPSVVVSLDDIELSATGEADPVARPHGVASRDLADDEVSGTAAASVESDCPPGTTATACERMKARRVTANAEHKIARRATRVAQTASARVAETRAGAHHDVASTTRVEERHATRVLQRQIERTQVRATAMIAEAHREANTLRLDADAQRAAADEAKAELENLDAKLATAQKQIEAKDENSGAAKLAMESAVHSITAARESGRKQGFAEAKEQLSQAETNAVEVLRSRLETAETKADELVRAEAAAQAAYNTGKTKSDVVEKALRATLETAQRDAADAKAAATNTRARFAKEIRARDAAIKKASEEVSQTHLEAATLRGKLDATAKSLDEARSENQLLRAQEVELRTQAEDLTARVGKREKDAATEKSAAEVSKVAVQSAREAAREARKRAETAESRYAKAAAELEKLRDDAASNLPWLTATGKELLNAVDELDATQAAVEDGSLEFAHASAQLEGAKEQSKVAEQSKDPTELKRAYVELKDAIKAVEHASKTLAATKTGLAKARQAVDFAYEAMQSEMLRNGGGKIADDKTTKKLQDATVTSVRGAEAAEKVQTLANSNPALNAKSLEDAKKDLQKLSKKVEKIPKANPTDKDATAELSTAAATFAVADAHSMSYPSIVVSLDDIELSATGEANPTDKAQLGEGSHEVYVTIQAPVYPSSSGSSLEEKIKGAIVDEIGLDAEMSQYVTPDDVGFVQARWLLVGGLVLPRIAPDQVDENAVCEAIAADIGVLRMHMECSATNVVALSEKFGAPLGDGTFKAPNVVKQHDKSQAAALGAVPEYPGGGQEGVEFAFAVFGVSDAEDFYETAAKMRAEADFDTDQVDVGDGGGRTKFKTVKELAKATAGKSVRPKMSFLRHKAMLTFAIRAPNVFVVDSIIEKLVAPSTGDIISQRVSGKCVIREIKDLSATSPYTVSQIGEELTAPHPAMRRTVSETTDSKSVVAEMGQTFAGHEDDVVVTVQAPLVIQYKDTYKDNIRYAISQILADDPALDDVKMDNIHSFHVQYSLVAGIQFPFLDPEHLANDNTEICDAIAADLSVNRDQIHCVIGGGAWEEFEHLENPDINADFVGATVSAGSSRVHEGHTKLNLPHFHDAARPIKGVEFSFAVFGVYDEDKFMRLAQKMDYAANSLEGQFDYLSQFPAALAVSGATTWELTFLRHNARVEYVVQNVNGTSPTVKDILSRPSTGGYVQGACGQECFVESAVFASEIPQDDDADDDEEDAAGAAALSMPWFHRRAKRDAVAAIGQGESTHDYPSGERRDVWVTIQVPMNVERRYVREELFPTLAEIVTGAEGVEEPRVVNDDIAHVHSHFVIIAGIIVPNTLTEVLDLDQICHALEVDLDVGENSDTGGEIACYRNGTSDVFLTAASALGNPDGTPRLGEGETESVSGQVIVFAITEVHDEAKFASLISRINLSVISSEVDFDTVAALSGGRYPVVQFLRHHARLTYAIDTHSRHNADAVMRTLKDLNNQALLSQKMEGQTFIRNVAYRLPPHVSLETEVDAEVTANRTEWLWNAPMDASAALGLLKRAHHVPAASLGDGDFKPDVWTTIQVPMNTARQHIRDDIFPAFATIVKGDHVGAATGVADDDIAFVKSHFVLIGGVVIPGDGSDPADSGVVDIDVVCKALAGDLDVPIDNIGCYHNGTVTAVEDQKVAAMGSMNLPEFPPHDSHVTGDVIVFAVTGLEDEGKFTSLIAQFRESDVNTHAELTSLEAMAGGHEAQPQFARFHAFVTYATRVHSFDQANQVMATLKAPEARSHLRERMQGRCFIRDVKTKLPPFDHDIVHGSTEAADQTGALWGSEVWSSFNTHLETSDAVDGLVDFPVDSEIDFDPEDLVHHDEDHEHEHDEDHDEHHDEHDEHEEHQHELGPNEPRSVHVTVEAPWTLQDMDVRPHVFPGVLDVVRSRPGSSGVVFDDLSLLSTEFILMGTLTLDQITTETVDVEHVCGALAADLDYAPEAFHCHSDYEGDASEKGVAHVAFAVFPVPERSEIEKMLQRFERIIVSTDAELHTVAAINSGDEAIVGPVHAHVFLEFAIDAPDANVAGSIVAAAQDPTQVTALAQHTGGWASIVDIHEDDEVTEAGLGMSAELRREIFNAGLDIPGDTEAIEEADESMEFYSGDAPEEAIEDGKKEARLGMGPEERREIFNAGLDIPGDTEAIEEADDSMDFYTGSKKHHSKKHHSKKRSDDDDAELGMGDELRREIFNAGLDIPGDTEAVEEADDSMEFYTGDTRRHSKKHHSKKRRSEKDDDSELGMGYEERRLIFNAGLDVPDDPLAVKEADDSMDFYAGKADEEDLNPLPGGDDYDYGLASESKKKEAGLGDAKLEAEMASWYDSLPTLKVQGEVIVWPTEEDAAAQGGARARLGASPEVISNGPDAVDFKTFGAALAATAALAGIALVGMRAHRARREREEEPLLVSAV